MCVFIRRECVKECISWSVCVCVFTSAMATFSSATYPET